jgi:hypothetical protein
LQNPKNRNSSGLLTSLCVLAFATAAHVSTARAQNATPANDVTTGAVTAATASAAPAIAAPSAIIAVPAAEANSSAVNSESSESADKTERASSEPVVPLRPVHVQPNTRSEQSAHPGRPYFIEFRARSAYNYGHTFVVHGRVGEPLTRKSVVGLHPAGDAGPWMIGHLIPVPSETGWSDGDIGYNDAYITAKYRVYLTEAEYRILVSKMRQMQASSPVWHAALYNCNAFTGDIAKFLGMQTPFHWHVPKDYINGIKQMAGGRQELPSSWLERMNPRAAAEQARMLAAARHQHQIDATQEAHQPPQAAPQTAATPVNADPAPANPKPASANSRKQHAAAPQRANDTVPSYATAQ